MKIFVSWSGERGRALADAVCRLLASGEGAARVEPWMSTRIRHGRPWALELLSQLEECRACVVCLTADTLSSPWLGFEAGAILGAGADPGRVVCIGLDVEPRMLDGHALARFRMFDASAEGMHALWQTLRPGTEPSWPALAWKVFEMDRDAVPGLTPRAFTVLLDLPSGLTLHPVESDHDWPFDELVSKLLEWHGDHVERDETAAFRCLDIDGERWLPLPRRLSAVRTPRLAVLHPKRVRQYQSSDRLASIQLREAIDVIPRVNAAIASMRRDLRDLVDTQVRFHAEHGRYASDLRELNFLPAPGNEVDMIAGERGFAARARCDQASGYGVRVGDGAGRFEGQPEGEPFLLA